MRKLYRITAFVLVFTLLITCNVNIENYHAKETSEQGVSTSVAGSNDITVEGINSFGTLFANTIAAEMAEQEENTGYNVFSVEMIDTVAEVSFETQQYATLVVAIYDETGVSMLATGQLEVMPEETKGYVDIDIDEMPDYFYIKSFLIDKETMRPLCTVYESSMYTEEMQDFLEMTVEDFDENKVLNLDDDITNNFAVYSDETIIIPESDESNKVVQSNSESDIYIFENIDDNISDLKRGDIFAYEYDDGEILIVKVDSIDIEGTMAIIEAEDVSMEEVFDYVKIDENIDAQDVIVDESTCEEGVIYEGDVEIEEETLPETYGTDISASAKLAKRFTFKEKK